MIITQYKICVSKRITGCDDHYGPRSQLIAENYCYFYYHDDIIQ